MQALIQLIIFLVPLVVCGLIIGGLGERRHFQRIREREAAHANFLVTQLKSYPMSVASALPPMLVTSEVVIASDYLKSFLSGLRKVFGGEMKSFRLMQDRAKREALLRLIEKATAQGYNAICNVRVTGADIGGNTSRGRKKVHMAAVIATATAYHAGNTNQTPVPRTTA